MFKITYEKTVAFSAPFFIFGFYLVAALSDFLYTPNGLLTISFRVIVFCVSLLLIVTYLIRRKVIKLNKNECIIAMLFAVFFILYYLTILKGIINHESFALNEIEYFFWVFVVCLIPSFIYANINYLDLKFFLVFSAFILSATVLLTLFNYFQFLASDEVVSSRLQSKSVNPIALGYSAVSLALISTVAIRADIYRYTFIVVFFTSIVFAILSGSRGAALALLVVLAFLFLRNINFRLLKNFLLITFIVLALSSYLGEILFEFNGVDVFSTFLNAGSKTDISANIRFISYEGGLRQFSTNYLFGDHIEERTTGFYPHNIVIEVLMSTGILGFVFFIIPVSFIFVKAVYLLKFNSIHCLMAMLFLQYLVGSLFSGAIFNNYPLWYMTMAVLFSRVVILESINKKTGRSF